MDEKKHLRDLHEIAKRVDHLMDDFESKERALTTATDEIKSLTRELEQATEKGELLCCEHGAALIEISRLTRELEHESGMLDVARRWVEKWQKEDPLVKDLLELRRAISKRKAQS